MIGIISFSIWFNNGITRNQWWCSNAVVWYRKDIISLYIEYWRTPPMHYWILYVYLVFYLDPPREVIRNEVYVRAGRLANYDEPAWIINHYSDVIIGAMASQITGVSIVYSAVCSSADEKIKAPHHWPLWGKSTDGWWIPLKQRASNAENVSIWWRHHDHMPRKCGMKLLIHSQTSNVQSWKFRNG